METALKHALDIDAPPSAVWAVLTDTAAYPDWNPFITRLTGDLHVDTRLEAVIAPPGGRVMTFRPTVLAVRPERELRWRGRILLPGLFDGEHTFELQPLPGDRTRLVQSERFTGLLVRALRGQLEPTEQGFKAMNEALAAETARRLSTT